MTTSGEAAQAPTARADQVLAEAGPVLAGGEDVVLVADADMLQILAARWLGLSALAAVRLPLATASRSSWAVAVTTGLCFFGTSSHARGAAMTALDARRRSHGRLTVVRANRSPVESRRRATGVGPPPIPGRRGVWRSTHQPR
jgi:hypothetical protein